MLFPSGAKTVDLDQKMQGQGQGPQTKQITLPEAKEFAKDRGMHLERTDSPNTDVEFIEAMASAVRSVAPPPSGWTSPAAHPSHLKKLGILGLDAQEFRGPR